MIRLLLILLLLSTSVFAGENTGRVYFGKNLAKPLDEHTERLYFKIDNSETLYFNRKHDGPVLENLDATKDHAVNVYFDDKVVQSWILNFSKLETHSVLIWRSAGSWRMEAFADSDNAYQRQKQVRVALAPIFCLDGDRSGNLVRIENAIIEAKEKGAEIVCFAEMSILGWVNPNAHQRAFPIPGEDSGRLCELAKKHDIFLCIGLAEKEGENLFDTAILIDNSGNILLRHRKNHILTWLMAPPYTPGKSINAVDTKFGKIGILICADSYFDQILHQMEELKPDIVIIPYGWVQEEAAWPEHGNRLLETVRKAAKIIGAPVIGTNPVGEITHGPWTGLLYGGSSIAVGKNGDIAAKGKDRDRDVVVTTITY